MVAKVVTVDFMHDCTTVNNSGLFKYNNLSIKTENWSQPEPVRKKVPHTAENASELGTGMEKHTRMYTFHGAEDFGFRK